MRTQRMGHAGVELAYDLEELATTYNTVGMAMMAQGSRGGEEPGGASGAVREIAGTAPKGRDADGAERPDDQPPAASSCAR